MSRKRNTIFILLFAAAAFVVMTVFVAYLGLLFYLDDGIQFGDAVAVVDISGEIYYDIAKIQEIEDYRDDGDVKAILVHINSPGGGVVGSQALYRALEKASETKPVVAVMGAVAASGGYYVACAADTIFAMEGTVTGSIGVIAAYLRTEELFRKIGLEVTVIKSGEFKDVGSPHRPMTAREIAYLSDLLDGMYEQFLQAVSDGRGMDIEEVRVLAEGRLYTGLGAREVGLIDAIGSYEDALYVAAELGGIDGHPSVIRREKKVSWLERVLGRAAAQIPFPSDDRIALKYIIP
ncbi:MAG: signal peptide peptidase SppA [bacterium]|nr:signal peptide peptidase SppA [bacterium]